MACGFKDQSKEKQTPKWGDEPLPRKKWSKCRSLCSVAGRLPELVEDISMVSRYMQVSELQSDGVRGRLRGRGSAAVIRPWDLVQSFYSWTVEKEKPTVPQMHNFLDIVHRMAGRLGEGWARAQAGWGSFTTESLLFEMIFPLVIFLSVRVSLDCALLCRSLSLGWCRPQPSPHSCLAHAPPSGSPDEQQHSAHWGTTIREQSSHAGFW